MKRYVLNIFVSFSVFCAPSCETKKEYDDLKYVEITNKELNTFLTEYQNQLETPGVITLDILGEGIYVAYHQLDYYKEDIIAPLTYTKINDEVVLIYSGIENILNSAERKKETVELLEKKVLVLDSIEAELHIPMNYHPPVGWLILCGDTLLRYKEISQDPKIYKYYNPFYMHPCVNWDTTGMSE